MDVLYRCCCGLDVHAKTVMACLIKDGQKQTRNAIPGKVLKSVARKG